MTIPVLPVLECHSRHHHFGNRIPNYILHRLKASSGITKDETKYHHVVAAIETDVIAQISDIILNPPEELKYEALKERLIEQSAHSETHRLKLLLQELQLGDDRPTELLCKMRGLSS
ncbi:hypothetical protein AVEN_214394-1 [Araneus ventricosus]|uniref:DUF7041 domain-containing protein n=1 Tax=Araneus ventricosus TaxID=182803 RepID=A0A4Y2UEK1_ARAVE|nr:hypothetical protein AVEN_214394-1 [Araneus ventricosus]